ncbi:MAG TPA: DUF2127 domain-containing protein [Phycisphaerae bacterium]|nr:DUF2127 domain-containing protein [Phycisphaerae bacterium]
MSTNVTTPSAAPAVKHHRNGILLLIAAERLLKAAAFIITGIALLKFVHVDLILLAQSYIDKFHLDPRSQGVEWVLRNVAHIQPSQIRLAALGVFCYSGLFIIEGVGLYYQKIWAEWLILFEVALFCPLEFLEIQKHPAMWHILIFIVNVLIVFYLLFLRIWALQMKPRVRRIKPPKPKPPEPKKEEEPPDPTLLILRRRLGI